MNFSETHFKTTHTKKGQHGAKVTRSTHLLGHVGVFLLLFGLQHSPPVCQDLGGPAVVQARMFLTHQGAVALAKEEEGIHRTPGPLLVGVLLRLLRCASTLHLQPLLWATQHRLLAADSQNIVVFILLLSEKKK